MRNEAKVKCAAIFSVFFICLVFLTHTRSRIHIGSDSSIVKNRFKSKNSFRINFLNSLFYLFKYLICFRSTKMEKKLCVVLQKLVLTENITEQVSFLFCCAFTFFINLLTHCNNFTMSFYFFLIS